MTPIASPSNAAALKVCKYSSCWGMLLVDGSTGIVMNTITFTVQQLWGKEEQKSVKFCMILKFSQ
jgi:hypothetical protein